MSLNIQNVYFKNHWIVEYVKDHCKMHVCVVGNKQFIMLLNVQNVHFENHWIVEYVIDQYILKNPKNI